jgi:hypothetical protein
VRCHHDSAIEGIVLREVTCDEIVVGLAGVVAEENSAGVVRYDVIGNSGILDAEEMDSFATVEVFTGLEGRLAGAGDRFYIQACVVVEDMVFLMVTSDALVTRAPS